MRPQAAFWIKEATPARPAGARGSLVGAVRGPGTARCWPLTLYSPTQLHPGCGRELAHISGEKAKVPRPNHSPQKSSGTVTAAPSGSSISVTAERDRRLYIPIRPDGTARDRIFTIKAVAWILGLIRR